MAVVTWVFDPREPSMTTHALRDGEYVETHTVKGDDLAEIAEPFPVTVCPAKLTRPGAGGS